MKLSLYYPLNPVRINQKFGNIDPKYSGMGLVGHNGMDFAALHGQPVYAAHDGVAYYQIDEGGGHGVVIRTNDKFDYNGTEVYFKTIYWHFADSVKEPQYKSPIEGHSNGVPVRVGDLIGYADNTGLSTGDHLHFGLKTQALNEADGAYYNLDQNNGYLGAIDPSPYLNGLFAKEGISNKKYYFDTNLQYGSRGEAVKYLQRFLVGQGYLTSDLVTGFYGLLTRHAVYQLQVDYQMPLGTDWIYLGFYFGNKTRTFLNQKFK
jgi:hypothetical protein